METAAAVTRNGNGHEVHALQRQLLDPVAGFDRRRLRRHRNQSPIRLSRSRDGGERRRRFGSPSARLTVFGVLSLILWTLILIVTVKYVLILLRADNNGEGGTLSLMALAQRAAGGKTKWITMMGIMAASLFYGDAVITPAISVISAVEGLNVVTPAFDALRRSAHHRHPHRAVHRPVSGNRHGRPVLRPDHGGVVRGHGGRRSCVT